MNITTVIFDFDGTLFDSLKIAYKATCAVFEEMGQPAPTFADYQNNCHPPFVPYYHSKGVNLSSEQIWESFLRLANFEDGELFWDVRQVLEGCVLRGIGLGLISSQQKNILDNCCAKHGLTTFFPQGVIGGALDKAPVITAYCEDKKLTPVKTIYVGDSVFDMRCAVRAGVKAVGITRGHPTRKQLEDAGASHCVDHLEELLTLI